ncbi:CypX cytochrome P450 [Pyrenophora tritici-repentis]|nr:CypX Cytochrome P450 [Pyrenophora tritici-repentis]KAI0573618.1 CypX cytochrome P450 [Pyrenophora tritici-repentis]KAI0605813.1 CypX Cytochrome P450 [Pyrenophora tritici-repentis]PZD25777.1 CypX, Cytochrome P450 [Pyrenophora tritici-repentis]
MANGHTGIKGPSCRIELEQLHRKYGSIVRTGPNEVSVADWRHIRTINPSEHAARRKLSSPPYALNSIARLDPLIQKNADTLVHRLISEAGSSTSGTADAYRLCALFSLETICKAAFAKDFDGIDGMGASLELLRAMDGSALVFLPQSLFPFLGSTGLGTKLPGFIGNAYRSHQIWEQLSRNMVDHFLEKSSADNKYLLSPVATDIDTFLGRRLSHEELIEEAMGYMFAGSGTTSSTLTYLLYALSLPENLHVQERLRDTIRTIPADDVTAMRQDPYLNVVIKETFRLFPTIVSTLPRILLEPLQLGEYSLPKGTIVGIRLRNNQINQS